MTVTSETEIGAARGSRGVLFASLRLLVVLVIATAIVATFFDTASRATINPFNFFGYFTMQSNIITAVILLLAAVATFRGRPQTPLLVLLRACATTYIVIVGIVYNTLLTGLEGGISLDWANWVLHVAFPVYAALDWILFGDRSAVPWRNLWVVLIFPAVWIVVVLIRGATDGWVPYPFLDPAQGYGIVAMYCIVIFIATVVVGALVFAISRVRVIAP
ncbi:Pr6Pr family membrane protein [Agromyces albus]|uniref:F420-dependent oxidoreductase n=1 Tax=Agromyces albus TaxID=205332 RepID=A0A4Q2L1S1_9MICO|nr:Pr6Pr family membrane protein [Agromyces albus]RXZ72015.1 hypothetical protein ESP51_06500 [Agromyces albus]